MQARTVKGVKDMARYLELSIFADLKIQIKKETIFPKVFTLLKNTSSFKETA